MKPDLDDTALDQIFRQARTYNAWSDRPVTGDKLQAVYDLAKMGPTSANVSKAKLLPYMSSSNRAKTAAAPVTVIIAYDLDFADQIPLLFPQNPGAKDWFSDLLLQQETAMRNGSLQGAYFMIAARALGLDCGPMSGFDKAGVDTAFFAGTRWRANFLCNLGYGTTENLLARLPRLPFEIACRRA